MTFDSMSQAISLVLWLGCAWPGRCWREHPFDASGHQTLVADNTRLYLFPLYREKADLHVAEVRCCALVRDAAAAGPLGQVRQDAQWDPQHYCGATLKLLVGRESFLDILPGDAQEFLQSCLAHDSAVLKEATLPLYSFTELRFEPRDFHTPVKPSTIPIPAPIVSFKTHSM